MRSNDDDPPGVDLALWRIATTRLNLVVATVLSLAITMVLLRWPEHFHLASRVPLWLFAAWPISFACARRLELPRQGRWLAPLFVHGVALFAALGACSRDSFAAGWSLLLLLPPCWGHLFPKNRTIVISSFLLPPLLRFASVSDASPRSIFDAAACGAFVAIAFWTFSRKRLRTRAWEEESIARQALGAATAEEAAALVTSMRLHDGLSGLLMLAHARASRAADAEAIAAARNFAQHARAMLAGFAAPRSTDLRTTLEELARSTGLQLTLELDELPDDPAVAELREIAVELLANQARHGQSPAISLRVFVARGRLRAKIGGAPPEGSAGRGQRNLLLRVQARGGELRRKEGIEIVLPLERATVWSSLQWTEALLHVGAPLVAWWSGIGIVGTITCGAASLILALVQMRTTARLSALRSRERAQVRDIIERASGPSLDRVRATLPPALDRLEHALDEDRAELRPALETLTRAMQQLMFDFESGFSAEGRGAAPPAPLRAGS